ncbi:MAG TPA: hypothetical protein V6D08_07450 [Candidatus Obscuribacterales bacterium]
MVSTLTKEQPSGPKQGVPPHAERPARAVSKSGVLALASLLTLLVTYLCLRVQFFAQTTRPLNLSWLNPALTDFFGGVDTSRYQAAYLQSVVVLTVLVIAGPVLARLAQAIVPADRQTWWGRAAGVMWFLVTRSAALLPVWFFVESFFWWSRGRMPYLLLSLLALPLLYLFRRGLESEKAGREYRFTAGLLLAAALLPGLFSHFDLSGRTVWGLEMVQAHYALTAGQGDRLAAGLRLFHDANPAYGVLLPVMLGAWQQHIHPVSFGGYVTIIRCLQAAFLLAAAFLFVKYARGWKLASFFALVFLVPWCHINQAGINFPSHTAWCLIGQPLALVVLFLLRYASLAKAAYCTGATSLVLLLLNPETGLAGMAALAVYLWFRYGLADLRNFRALVRAACFFALGAAASLSIFMLGCRLGLGYWPDLTRLMAAFPVLPLVAKTGYPGAKFDFQPVPAVIFGHAAFVLITTALFARSGLGFKQSFRAAIACFIIVTFANYAKGSESWNLTSCYFLYAFLFMDLVRAVLARFRKGKPTTPQQLLAAATLALVLLPELAFDFRNVFVPQVLQGVQVMRSGAVIKPARLVCGVYLAEDEAAELSDKAAFIRQASEGRPAVYFTANPFFVSKLSGVPLALPFADTYAGIVTRDDYGKLISLVKARRPERIYFDAPNCKLRGGAGWRRQYRQVRADLSELYEKEGEAHGWEIWRVKGSASASST